MSAVTIEQRRATDSDEIFRLYADVFGRQMSERLQQRWRWQYLDNPERTFQGPEIWVARAGDVILGQYASMPVRLFWAGRETRASWGMDVFVRAEARGKGVGVRLFTAWADHVEVALGLGLTPSSYGLFRKLGYHDVGPVPLFQRILDPKAVMERRLGRPWGSLASVFLRLGLAFLRPRRPDFCQHEIDVRRIEQFSPEYDELWERARSSYRMCVRRDARYLNWKYRQCPHRRYDLWEARRAGRLAGFAVTRHEELRGLRLGWIVDLFTEASDEAARGALLSAALGSFQAADVARVQAFAMSAALGRTLRRHRFFRSRSTMQFCVHSREADEPAFDDPGGWHVVFGDSDMDR